MRVIIHNEVHDVLVDFYEFAKNKYITLDASVVIHKMQRIYDALGELGRYAYVCPKARLRKDWIDKGYQECLIEDFHFAFEICLDEESGEEFVYVHEACHSLLYRG